MSVPEYLAYHDDEWGRPVTDDVRIYEKLCLEGFQSGLSWLTILRKREGFRRAFAGFEPERVARFGPKDVNRLLGNAEIVRHRGKIEATIANARERHSTCRSDTARSPRSCGPSSRRGEDARAPRQLRELPASTPESKALSKELLRNGFRFVGPTTVYAAMQSLGLTNDHLVGCHARAACTAERNALAVTRR